MTPWLCAVDSNTPLWSFILAKTGGLSWLVEANRLVCMTLSQVVTTLLDGGHVCSSRYPWGGRASVPNLKPPLVGLRGGWGRGGMN